jgi:phage terminase large subunit-like protein
MASIPNCVHVRTECPTSGPHGDVIAKDRHNSPRKIDAAVAMILAVDRAAEYATAMGRAVYGLR